jgi:hypothetical protein
MSATRVRWIAMLGRLGDYLRQDAAIYAAVGLFLVLSTLYLAEAGKLHPDQIAQTFSAYAQLFVLDDVMVFPLLFLGIGYVVITLRLNRRRGLAYRYMFGPVPVARFVAGLALMGIAFVPFRTMFNAVKNAIPEHGGFMFDRVLADLDEALHLGVAPWEWLYGMFKHPWVLRAVEINYETVWFVICFGIQYWVAVSPLFDRVRVRYMLCFILSWVLIGNVAASMVSSAGPVYYAFVTGDFHRFGEVMSFTASMQGQFAATADFQNYLWYLHVNDLPGLGSGISAFPSMHVAIVVMNALFLIEVSRKWVMPAMIYVAFVVASSVYLGWHYAVDGYAAAIMMVAIHFALKKAMSVRWRLWPAREHSGLAVPD